MSSKQSLLSSTRPISTIEKKSTLILPSSSILLPSYPTNHRMAWIAIYKLLKCDVARNIFKPNKVSMYLCFYTNYVLICTTYKYDSVQDSYEEHEFWMTRLGWVGIQLNRFEMFEEHEHCLSRWKQCCSSWKQRWMKPCINR